MTKRSNKIILSDGAEFDSETELCEVYEFNRQTFASVKARFRGDIDATVEYLIERQIKAEVIEEQKKRAIEKREELASKKKIEQGPKKDIDIESIEGHVSKSATDYDFE